VAVQQDFSLELLEYIDSYTGDAHNSLKKFFVHPGIFDGLVSIMIREMTKRPMRPHLCDKHARRQLIHQLVTKIRKALGTQEIRTFAEICEELPIIKLELKKSDLKTLRDLQKEDVFVYKLYL